MGRRRSVHEGREREGGRRRQAGIERWGEMWRKGEVCVLGGRGLCMEAEEVRERGRQSVKDGGEREREMWRKGEVCGKGERGRERCNESAFACRLWVLSQRSTTKTGDPEGDRVISPPSIPCLAPLSVYCSGISIFFHFTSSAIIYPILFIVPFFTFLQIVIPLFSLLLSLPTNLSYSTSLLLSSPLIISFHHAFSAFSSPLSLSRPFSQARLGSSLSESVTALSFIIFRATFCISHNKTMIAR